MIIAIASHKGGVAKTTTAVHLACYLQKKHGSVLLVDGDPNRSATAWSMRGAFPFKVIDERQAVRYAREFDNIVIDTKARPERGDLQELAQGCNFLIIPTTPDVLALDALTLIVDDLRKLNSNSYRVLLTIVPPKPSHDGEDAQTALKEWNLPFFDGYVRRYIAFQKAALAGVPVYKAKDPRANEAWTDYKNIGDQIK